MKLVLISACLLGHKVRYDGGENLVLHPVLERWIAEDLLVPVCPEVAGGLSTPRPPAEMTSPNGADVLVGRAKVLTNAQRDVSANFIRGAEHALCLAQEHGVGVAVLKARSPSCGSKRVYDGSNSKTIVDGVGVTAALLREHGILVFSEEELDLADEQLRALAGDR